MVLEYWMWPGVGVSLYGARILDVAWCRSKLVCKCISAFKSWFYKEVVFGEGGGERDLSKVRYILFLFVVVDYIASL